MLCRTKCRAGFATDIDHHNHFHWRPFWIFSQSACVISPESDACHIISTNNLMINSFLFTDREVFTEKYRTAVFLWNETYFFSVLPSNCFHTWFEFVLIFASRHLIVLLFCWGFFLRFELCKRYLINKCQKISYVK